MRRGREFAEEWFNLMKVNNVRLYAVLFLIYAMFGGAESASAHPHVIIDGREEIVFDAQTNIIGIRSNWTFDKGFSAFATIGMDKDGDGKLSREELAPLAEINVTSLVEYEYFTHISIGGKDITFKPPVDYYATEEKGRITLHFTLPLTSPVKVTDKTDLIIFDPEYFIAFKFNEKSSSLIGAPANCSAHYHPPGELDAKTMAKISAVPVEQHDLPPDLREASRVLANRFVLQCSQ